MIYWNISSMLTLEYTNASSSCRYAVVQVRATYWADQRTAVIQEGGKIILR